MSLQSSFDAASPPTPSATKKMLKRLSWRKSAPVTPNGSYSFTVPPASDDTRDVSPPRVTFEAPSIYTPIEEDPDSYPDAPPTPKPTPKARKRLSWRRSAPVMPASAPPAYPPYPFASQQQMPMQPQRASSDAMPSHYAPFHHAPTHHGPTAAAHARAMRRQSLPVPPVVRRQPSTKHSLARAPSIASIQSVESTSSTASSRVQGRMRPSNESRTTLHSYVQGRNNRRKSTQMLFNVVSSLMLIMPSTTR
ncbi:hypothetical protein FB45DRAFT_1063430 [Roridomyces roridus]|uniref:Uncharacterized protein n=1 Tax=Roridomyces roridus TaxID=1738132 RepID=A0AAD7BDQ7_9AGAR|nr:hypothetical protein FB45DRAFT_1063430 [Roridomyces roridus]